MGTVLQGLTVATVLYIKTSALEKNTVKYNKIHVIKHNSWCQLLHVAAQGKGFNCKV